jgi:hypothetical protein
LEKKMSKYKTVPTVKTNAVPIVRPLPVDAVISLPRVGFVDNGFCIMGALGALGISIRRHHGAFWEQGIQNIMEDVKPLPNPYILTLDYDTWFTHAHVLRLYWLMETYPELDAIIPCQSRREGETAMLTVEGTTETKQCNVTVADFESHDYMPISNGHFGCSMIRKSSLDRLEFPWFHSQPNKDGQWREHRTDADIYFWDKAMKAGWKCGMATDVFIGHLQLVCTFPSGADYGLTATHVKINDLGSGNIPEYIIPKIAVEAPVRGPIKVTLEDREKK